jgi:hypothetical protein
VDFEECGYKAEYNSHNETDVINMKEEEDPLLVTLPVVKAESQVSCMSAVEISQWFS